jgi:hypothetical protein
MKISSSQFMVEKRITHPRKMLRYIGIPTPKADLRTLKDEKITSPKNRYSKKFKFGVITDRMEALTRLLQPSLTTM